MPDTPTASRPEECDGLIDRILQELRGSGSNRLTDATQTFFCELLSAILLRSYRTYSLEKLFGQGNSGPRGAVKDAIEEDSLEMSFDAVSAFAARHGYRPIETVRGNRVKSGQPGLHTGEQFFDLIWGDQPHGSMSRERWDEAIFRQQYHRIREELGKLPGPAWGMRREFEQTLAYRFFQSHTVFSYPDTNGTFASTSKPAKSGGQRPRKVWYHQTPLLSEEVSIEALGRVVRCNENPAIRDDTPQYWKPRRLLPKEIRWISSWNGVKSYCR